MSGRGDRSGRGGRAGRGGRKRRVVDSFAELKKALFPKRSNEDENLDEDGDQPDNDGNGKAEKQPK